MRATMSITRITSSFVLVACLAVGATSAHADDDARRAVTSELVDFQLAVKYGKEDGDRASGRFRATVADCKAVIARGDAAGFAPGDLVDGGAGKLLWKHAGALCDEYGRYRLMVEAAGAITAVYQMKYTIQAIEPGSVTQEWIDGYGGFGKTCIDKVDALIAAGAPADVALPINGELSTLTAGKAAHCQLLVDWAARFTAESNAQKAADEAARAARVAEATTRWKKAGLSGDRLRTFVEYDGDAWYVPSRGCTEETRPAALKKAKVLYRWLSSGDWSHTLVRYEWRGQSLARTSEHYFDTRGKASAGCR